MGIPILGRNGWGVAAILTVTLALTAGLGYASSDVKPQQPTSTAKDSMTTEAALFFEAKVRPVLVERCYSCHSEKTQQGGLRLDSREALLKGGVRGAVIVPGEPQHSLLLTSLSYTDKDLKMPPSGKLKASEIAALTAWVKMGAVWSVAQSAKTSLASRIPANFWAYTPPKIRPLPKVKNTAWVLSPIDRFILAGLEAKWLHPAPMADKRTLIRRATFDLTGLPPTPQEIKEFLSDTRSDAFARALDRLLASSAYGGRWGRHWLDVARYADSNGLDENLVYPNAWRYRDYVIRAFNQDKPIDRFIHEQIAGDLLPSTGREEADYDKTIATGYLVLGAKMLAEDDPVKQEEDIIDEQIDTLGKTFLGATIGCARCHDHKFDPFPQTDYYSLAGIFKSTKTMMNFKVVAEWQEIPLASTEMREKREAIDKTLRAFKKEMEEKRKTAREALEKEVKRKTPQYLLTAQEVLKGEGSGATLQPLLEKSGSVAPKEAILLEAEDFTRGNVLKDRDGFGKGIGVLVNAGQYPNETEYEVNIPEAAPYQLDLRYASGDPRPILIYVNGVVVSSKAAGQVTGGFYPDKQRWFAEGVFPLREGKNTIRFERGSYFPHIDKLLLTSRKGKPVPRTLEQFAAEAGLIPELLAQAAEQLRKPENRAKPELALELPDDADRLFSPALQADLKRLKEEMQQQEKAMPQLPRAMAVSEGSPLNMRVHLRGSYLTLGQECPRQFPVVLAGNRQSALDGKHSGRLELAQWMTRKDHPLTARVFVNRVWRWHFGQGIVGSTDNFGSLGERPVNQPLLDWLALTFIEDGWSLKKLHRRIMLSRAYQMSSRYDPIAARTDPENRLHWRNSRHRLEVEAIRDSMLSAGGQLDRTLGGSLLNLRDREYVTSTANSDPVNYTAKRRSVYLPVIRSALYEVYTAFDFGDPTVMNGDRPSTTVAPQALFMMNSSLALEQTKAMAIALLAHTDLDDAGRIQLAYETCYARAAQPAEVQRALGFTRKLERGYAVQESNPAMAKQKAWQSLCKALISANEFIFIE